MDGRCTCGEIRYRVTDVPLFTHCCHCRWCQRETGSAFVLNAMIEADEFEVLRGSPVAVNTPSESGIGQIIHRCPSCMVALWSTYGGGGAQFFYVRVGTLENPDACPPDINIFTESKQPWVVLDRSVPAVPQFYVRSQYWPDESLLRRQTALERA